MKKRHLGWKTTAALVLAAAPIAHAQATRNWTGTGTDNLWSDASNWDTGIPGTGDTAAFATAGNNNTVSLGGATQPISTLLFNGSGVSFNLGVATGDIFGFDPVGAITVNSGAGGQTISAGIQTSGALTVTNNSTGSNGLSLVGNILLGDGNTFTLSSVNNAITTLGGTISGNNVTLTPLGGGAVVFKGQNTYSGTTSLSGAGTDIQIGSSSVVSNGSIVSGAFGSSTIVANNATNSPLEAWGADQVVANPINMITGFSVANAPTSGATADLTGAHNLTLTGPITFNGTASRTININTPGHVLTLGSGSGTPTTLTLAQIGALNVALGVAPGGTTVSNLVIQDNPTAPATPDTISFVTVGSGFGTFVVNGASTYTGNTTFSGGGSNGAGTWQIGVNSVTSGGNLVSGPFGVGQITFNNSGNPPVFEAVGTDRVIANPVLINTSGFWVASAPGQLYNLSFTGPINQTVGRTITNNMAAGTTFSFGAPGSNASTWALGAQVGIQSQAGSTGALTVINDLVSNGTSGTGTFLFQNGLIAQLTNPNNTYGGGNKINGATLMVSSDGNLGAATSAVSLTTGTATFTNTAGTLLSTGTFASARPFNLNGTNASNIVDVTSGNTLTLNGVVAGAGSLTKGSNGGTLALTNSNTYSGGTIVNGGTLGVASDGSLGSAAGAVTVNAGTLMSTAAGVTSARAINLTAATSTLDASSGSQLILTGPVTDAGTFNKGVGAGTVQLAQAAGYNASGDVNVNGGTLAIGDPVAGATGALHVGGALSVANGARLASIPSTMTTPTSLVHSIHSLNLNTSGTLDIGNNSVTIDTNGTSTAAQVRSYLVQSYNGNNWNGAGGITSSVVASNNTGQVKKLAVGYAVAGQLNVVPTVPANTVLVRPTMFGDTNLDGKVDNADISAIIAAGKYLDGTTNNSWAVGDWNYDGRVDNNDISNLIASGNYLSGQSFNGASPSAAAHASAKLTAASASPAVTTVGVSGDGIPDYQYDPATGDVKFRTDGQTGVQEVHLRSASSQLQPQNMTDPGVGLNGLDVTTPAEIDLFRQGSSGGTLRQFADGYDFNNILPAGLSLASLLQDLTLSYTTNGGGTSNVPATLIYSGAATPEPTSLALFGVAAAGLLGQRRRRRN